ASVTATTCTPFCSVSSLASLLSFFTGPPTTETYTLSLHDALPICHARRRCRGWCGRRAPGCRRSARPPWSSAAGAGATAPPAHRSEEHTSELQSRENLVCRLLLEKKKQRHDRPRTRPTTRAARKPR